MSENKNKIKQMSAKRRQKRTRAKIFGTSSRPRLNVTRTLNYIYLQLVDDDTGKTLLAMHSKSMAGSVKGNKTDIAKALGTEFAKKALAAKFETCIFDRAASPYHGRIKAVAEGLRAGGLKF